ncbi:MAG: hypothetical protein Kow0059_02880 [Candidatus Sumerlaeia bacterium]
MTQPSPHIQISNDRLRRLLDALLEISYYVGSVMELEDILEKITEITTRVMGADVSSVYLINEESQELILRATTGLDRGLVNKARFEAGRGLPGWVCRNNMLVALADAQGDQRFERIPGAEQDDCKAYLANPLRIQDRVIGCMTVRKRPAYEWSPEEITAFEAICKQVAIVIEKAQLYYGKIKMERLAAMTLSLAGVAHYIKNLLQGMSGGIYFIDSGLESENYDKVKKGWSILKRTSRKLSYLVENMLNFSRSSRPTYERDKITSVTDFLADYVKDTMRERGITLVYEPRRDLPDVLVDFSSMFDALSNLVSNAIDAMCPDREGVVRIRTDLDEHNRRVVVEVSDNGRGIPPEVLPRIFELFYTTKGSEGTGLGLAVTKKIIEEHFGDISVQTKLGEGTTFRVTLPFAEDAELRVQTSRATNLSLQ